MKNQNLHYMRYLSGIISEETYYTLQEQGGEVIAQCQQCGGLLDAMDTNKSECPKCMADFMKMPPKEIKAAMGGGKKGLMKKTGTCSLCAYPLTAMDVRSGECPNCMSRINPDAMGQAPKGPAPLKQKVLWQSY